MKIGLISINIHTITLNYACPLHTYAFHTFLKENGIESTVIDYTPAHYGKYDVEHPLYHYLKYPKRDAEEQARLVKKWKGLFTQREIRYRKFKAFIEKYYTDITPEAYTTKSLKKKNPGFDCYICVTDVIWKNIPGMGIDRGFLLAAKIMRGKKKIAYAASRGPGEYTPKVEADFLRNIRDFDFISVREKSLQDYIQKCSGREVPLVLDPVFLRDRAFYEELAERPNKKKGFVLVYFAVGKSRILVQEAAAYAKKYNLDVIELSEELEDANIPKGTHHDVIYDIGIEEWLGYMLEAEYIFTNSFHACCFSLIFEKQFFAGTRSSDKIDSLLNLFGLSWRRVKKGQKGISLKMEKIDFAGIRPALQKQIDFSTEVILDAIRTTAEKFEQEPRRPVRRSFGATFRVVFRRSR